MISFADVSRRLAPAMRTRSAAPTRTICQLVHGLPIGGTEVLVDRFVRRFAADYRILIACLDEIGELGEGLAREGFEVALLRRRPGFDWRCVATLRQYLRRKQVDLIHAHQYTPFAYALAARGASSGPKVLFTEHGRFFPDYPSWKRILFNRALLRRGDRVVAVGDAVRRALVANEGIAERRIDVIYNGTPLERFEMLPAPGEARRALGIAPEDFVALQVARLDRIKDHATSLRAMARLRRELPQAKLLLTGDGPEREALARLTNELQLQDTVAFLGMRRDVPNLLAAADVFLLSSVSEGIPVTVIEAMAAGVPVVSTDVGGVPEVIQHGDTGLLCSAGDAAALAAHLSTIHRDRSLASALASNAKQRVKESFSEQAMMEYYQTLYHSMLERRSNRRRTPRRFSPPTSTL